MSKIEGNSKRKEFVFRVQQQKNKMLLPEKLKAAFTSATNWLYLNLCICLESIIIIIIKILA